MDGADGADSVGRNEAEAVLRAAHLRAEGAYRARQLQARRWRDEGDAKEVGECGGSWVWGHCHQFRPVELLCEAWESGERDFGEGLG